MKRNSGRWTVVVSIIGSVLLTAACSTPTLPSDFPAFHLTSSPDQEKPDEPGTN
jgi:hypothetical protein